MHAIKNAFDPIGFGTNHNKIFAATLDDPLHFCNSGFFACLGQVAYLGMQEKERQDFESIVLEQLRGIRCSVRGDYPKGRCAEGFTNQTMLTGDEKVGSMFTMLLALHNDEVKAIVEKANERQQNKHMTFHVPNKKVQQEPKPTGSLGKTKAKSSSGNTKAKPTKSPGQTKAKSSTGKTKAKPLKVDTTNVVPLEADPEELLRFPLRHHLCFERQPDNFWPRTQSSNEFIILHLKKHGLAFLLVEDYDQLQLECLFVES
jgi:hypothetical protein